LEHGFVQMVPLAPAARGVNVEPGRREHLLPADLVGRSRVFALQREWEFHAAGSAARSRAC
jgi:hypothetical protein